MYRKIIYSAFTLLYWNITYAQSPDMYPPPVPERVDVSWFNLILYILLPILLVVAFFWYQRSQKKKRKKRQSEAKAKKAKK